MSQRLASADGRLKVAQQMHHSSLMESGGFHRRFRPLLTAIALHFATACTDQAREKQPKSFDAHVIYDYALDLPAEFKRQQVQGIDSKVEEWRSPNIIISTDFGQYSAPPTCNFGRSTCSVSKEMIAGRSSLVGRHEFAPAEPGYERKSFQYHVYIPVSEAHRLGLNMFAWCESKQTCEEALSLIRQVRILRREQHGSGRRPAGISRAPGGAD